MHWFIGPPGQLVSHRIDLSSSERVPKAGSAEALLSTVQNYATDGGVGCVVIVVVRGTFNFDQISHVASSRHRILIPAVVGGDGHRRTGCVQGDGPVGGVTNPQTLGGGRSATRVDVCQGAVGVEDDLLCGGTGAVCAFGH